MIPEAAVEAAREAVGAIFGEPANSRDMAHVMAILEAAAPHMLAEARFEAWEEGVAYALPGTQRGLDTFGALRKSNPYRTTK